MYEILPSPSSRRVTKHRTIKDFTSLGDTVTVYPDRSFAIEHNGVKVWFTANGELKH